jgi:hypothetical protein
MTPGTDFKIRPIRLICEILVQTVFYPPKPLEIIVRGQGMEKIKA